MHAKPKARDLSESLGKLPPQALDMEEAVLGAILLSWKDLERVIMKLRADHFYMDAHREIYNAIFNLWIANEPADIKSVVHQLRRSGKLEAVGGAYKVAELQSKVSATANIEHHARIVMEMALKRSLIQLAGSIHQEAYEDTTDVFEFIERVKADINGMVELSLPPNRPSLPQYIDGHRFDPSRPPNEEDTILTLNGAPIGSRENIITITGKSKSRKTVVASAIATSMFSDGGFLGFRSDLPDDARILHIDTEQGYKHYHHSVSRIFRDASVPHSERFVSIHTRDADIPMRLELIDHLVETVKPSVLIVDGLTDLVYDINDQAEATKIGERFLRLSSVHKLLVIGVIHTTKTTGFMTGAIGTIFEKKSETVIKVELMDGEPMVSNISCQFSRNRPFETFSIEADENGNYSILDEAKVIKNDEKPFDFYTKERHLEFLLRIFDKKTSIPREKIATLIKKHADSALGNQISRTNASKWLERYILDMMLIDAPGGLAVAFKPVRPLHDVQLKLQDEKENDDSPF